MGVKTAVSKEGSHSWTWPELYLYWTLEWLLVKQLRCFPNEAQNKCCKQVEVEREKVNRDLKSTVLVIVLLWHIWSFSLKI